jgi:hypothetical protein
MACGLDCQIAMQSPAFSWTVRPAFALPAFALAAAAILLPATALAQDEQPKAPEPSRVIEGRVDPYSYNPKDTEGHADPDVRGYYESLGPVAIEWHQHVQTLSSPFFEGRAPGSRGNELAAEYVEFFFRKANLEPAFPAPGSPKADADSATWTSYRQPFDLPAAGPKLVSASARALDRSLTLSQDFAVLGNSGSGSFEAPLIFAGYAIEEGREGYSSFAPDVDFTGRAVIMFRYEPLDEEGRSLWSERRFSPASGAAAKFAAVAKRNPAAIIMVNPPGARDGRRTLETTETSRFGDRLEIPVIQLDQDVADALVRAADPEGRSLMEWRRMADLGEVKSVPLRSDVKVGASTQLEENVMRTDNVGGVLRGKGSLADEWVIVGAHYDHVGYGAYGTSPQYRGQLHPGADDNASGTTTMMMLAKRMADLYDSEDSPADARSILFMAFSAEEIGLNGSEHWTRNPTIDQSRIQFMLNLDMVGRMRNDELAVSGTGTAKDFMSVLRPVFDTSGLTIRADPSGRGPSDHASFYNAGIPVLFFFTGSHGEYHTPKDVGYTVNPVGGVKVLSLADSTVRMLATRPERLEFQTSDSSTAGRRMGSRVRLGVMPGYGDDGAQGVKVEGVSADTSASEAGIRQGDLLIAWNGEALEGPAAMMERLREHKPGDIIKITFRRDGAEQTVDVTLKASQGQ